MTLRRLRHLPAAFAALLLVALAVTVASCGLFVSFGAYDTYSLAVGGQAHGLEGTNLTILLNASQPMTVGDGPFPFFPERLAVGTGYLVTVRDNPPGRACTVDAGAGRAASNDVTDIRVACLPVERCSSEGAVPVRRAPHPAVQRGHGDV